MTINEMQNEFIRVFNDLDDWLMQYEFLLELAGETAVISDRDRMERNRIKGCQSEAWILLGKDGGRLQITVDSESLLIRGILSIFVVLLKGRMLQEVADTEFFFLEKTSLKEQLAADRFSVMSNVGRLIQNYSRNNLK
ncbi:Cysteine desulfuration protein sufE [uncultured Roseburia sp.]|uniref:SufE family protein n=1 Tax=Brotonthovivens ammoniilytica TaxID=2981725 RepID=A0ABT2TG62_9FIRM|nr:SufE family protein [Brotonthovivens ammoniilytica]MCU6761185.1 SufE family protein [Brotonthovivens ammoniilytica]SCI21336.1 Cysteine desulfuration protein sufE [uncultured Roseburia sp.]